MMIKKSDLRSEFERIVKSQKTADFCVKRYRDNGRVYFCFERLPVLDFELKIEKFDKTWRIYLYAVNCLDRAELAWSFGFRSYKSAYQTLVRL